MQIYELTLISSTECNLQCEYCELNKSKNSQSKLIQTNTIQAFKDGSFLNNIKQIYKKLNANPKETQRLSLWGQEPTLTLDAWYSRAQEWFEFLPNLSSLYLSTNGIAFIDKLLNMVKILDKIITKDDFNISIQFSYDGELSTNNMRKTNDNIIIKNIKFFIEQLNNLTLSNVKININLNAVLSLYLINQLNSNESIVNYYNEISKVGQEIKSIILNPNVQFLGIGNKFQFPVDATSEDGQNVALFIKRAFQTAINNGILKELMSQSWITNILISKSMHITSWEKYISLIWQDKKEFKNFIEKLTNISNGCGSIHSVLKIMYDGTVLNCQTHLFDLLQNELYGNNELEIESKQNSIKRNHYINFLNDTIDSINNILYVYNEYSHNTMLSLIEHYMIMLNNMAAIGQVDKKYYNNPQLLLKHIILLLRQISCPYANQLKTGSIFTYYPGFFRFYFNGLADIIEEVVNNELLARK